VSLQDWLKSRWLIEHQTSPQEIADLLGMADRDLAQCRTPNLSPDWQLNIAYNVALQAATAALAAAGYRAAREAHHYRVIQSLAHTIKADPVLIAQLDTFRKKRNISGYERAGAVSEQEAKEMFALAKNLRNEVEKWLRSNHPELL
jgi:HEPN domain-containing protein